MFVIYSSSKNDKTTDHASILDNIIDAYIAAASIILASHPPTHHMQ
jgi:hypothetical protein